MFFNKVKKNNVKEECFRWQAAGNRSQSLKV